MPNGTAGAIAGQIPTLIALRFVREATRIPGRKRKKKTKKKIRTKKRKKRRK